MVGYPSPHPGPTVGGIEPGDQFRFKMPSNPVTGKERWGLAYVIWTDADEGKVHLFNVTEEVAEDYRAEVLNAAVEDGVLNKLDEKWGSTKAEV